ncbi:MAG: bifunctional riboflavin kinase/FAD synthetase [Cyanobium sp.]
MAWEDRRGERLALIPLSIPLHSPEQALRPTAIALGSFDGLHRGHRRVIAAVAGSSVSQADAVASVVSFWPHPREVLHGESRLRLDLPQEKLSLLAPLGIAQLVMIPFTLQLAALSPERFVQEVLASQLQARLVAVGENFRFGAGRVGTAEDLLRMGRGCGMEVLVLPMVADHGDRISSSRIRRALEGGEVREAARLMERPYRFEGVVVPGRGLGRSLGWPTANLQIDGRKFLPGEGVYAVRVWWDGAPQGALAGVMNLGPQPTVDPEAPSAVEVHLLDPPQPPPGGSLELTGQRLVVEPVQLLRRQQRFASLDDLVAAIAKDAEHAAQLLAPSPQGEA